MRDIRIKIGDWTVTPALNALESEGRSVVIEPRAMDLLVFLAEHVGEVLSTDDLVSGVWQGRLVGDHAVYRLIRQLRTAFGDDPRSPQYIATIARRGYRLIADVECPPDPAARSHQSVSGGRIARRYAGPGLAAAALIVVAMLIGLFFESPGSRVSPGDPTLAVLPFIDLSGTGTDTALGEGIAEEIIHALANGSDLRVVSRTSSFAFAGNETGIQEIGDELGASLILEGSIRRDGDRVRVVAQLVEAGTGVQLWSESFDEPFTDLLTLERGIAIGIAGRILGDDAEPARMERALPPVADISAYEYYLLGRERMRNPAIVPRAWRLTDADRAIEYFRRAIATDVGFARAHAALADALLRRNLIGGGFANPANLTPASREEVWNAIDSALAIDPELAEAHATRALALRVLQRDAASSEAAYRRAIALNPNLADAHFRLAMLLPEVRGAEIRDLLTMAVRLDPMSPEAHTWLGHFQTQIDPEAAVVTLRRAVELSTEPSLAHLFLSMALRSLGRCEEVIQLLTPIGDAPIPGRSPREIHNLLGGCYLDLGDIETAADLVVTESSRSDDINFRIHVALAENHNDEVVALTHAWDDELTALYEMLVGHEDHARERYDELMALGRLDGAPGYLDFGYHPKINAAYLKLSGGEADAAETLLSAARASLKQITETSELRSGQAQYLLASIESLEGDTMQALELLEEAAHLGWERHWYARIDPNLDNLRGEARFDAWLAGVRAKQQRRLADLLPRLANR